MRYEDARDIIAEALDLIDDVLNEAYEARKYRLMKAYKKARGDKKGRLQTAIATNSEKMDRRLKRIGARVATERGLDAVRDAGKAVSWNQKMIRGKLRDPKTGDVPSHLRRDIMMGK